MRLSPRVREIGLSIFRYRRGASSVSHPGFLNQIHERRGAAVHDRHFRRVQLDGDVVDSKADEGSQQVLDGIDLNGVPHEARRVIDRADVIDLGRQLEAAEVQAPEPNPRTRRGRTEREGHFTARMEADARTGNARGEAFVGRGSWSREFRLVVHVASQIPDHMRGFRLGHNCFAISLLT